MLRWPDEAPSPGEDILGPYLRHGGVGIVALSRRDDDFVGALTTQSSHVPVSDRGCWSGSEPPFGLASADAAGTLG